MEYQVIDRQTGEVKGTYKNRKRHTAAEINLIYLMAQLDTQLKRSRNRKRGFPYVKRK